MSLMRKDSSFFIDPFREITRLENDIRSVFDNFFSSRRDLPLTERVFMPLIDLRETDKKFILEVDLPGFKKEDIKVEVTPESVEIKAERKLEKDEEESNYIYRERYAYKFVRTIPLPSPINIDKIESSFKEGTLKLEMTKKEGTGKKIIPL